MMQNQKIEKQIIMSSIPKPFFLVVNNQLFFWLAIYSQKSIKKLKVLKKFSSVFLKIFIAIIQPKFEKKNMGFK
jgi:hypothetical protein